MQINGKEVVITRGAQHVSVQQHPSGGRTVYVDAAGSASAVISSQMVSNVVKPEFSVEVPAGCIPSLILALQLFNGDVKCD